MLHFHTPENIRKPNFMSRFQREEKWKIWFKWVKIVIQILHQILSD